MKMRKKSWAQKASQKLDEGALTEMGWPDGDKLVAAARKGKRGIVMKRLNFIANMGNAKARAIMNRIKREVPEE